MFKEGCNFRNHFTDTLESTKYQIHEGRRNLVASWRIRWERIMNLSPTNGIYETNWVCKLLGVWTYLVLHDIKESRLFATSTTRNMVMCSYRKKSAAWRSWSLVLHPFRRIFLLILLTNPWIETKMINSLLPKLLTYMYIYLDEILLH